MDFAAEKYHQFKKDDSGLFVIPMNDVYAMFDPEKSAQGWFKGPDDLQEWCGEPDPIDGIPFYGACSYWKGRQSNCVFPPWFWRQLADLNALGALWDRIRPQGESAPANRGWMFRLYWTQDDEVVAVWRGHGAHFNPNDLVGFVTREPYETDGEVRHQRVLTLLEESC